MVSDLISDNEKRQALERVVASRTFGRSDQLRGLLRFICEAEFEGRAQELNEYVLGVSVLGRPSNYSPTEDSCVRSRAYELRNKLKTYYRLENPADPIQIEIRKGAYIPQFLRSPETKGAEIVAEVAELPAVLPAATPEPTPVAIRPKRILVHPGILMVVIALCLGSLVYAYVGRGHAARNADSQLWTPEMMALWQPFVGGGAPLIVSYDIRLAFYSPHTGLVVRDYETNREPDLGSSRPLAAFRSRMGEPDLQATSDYSDSGAVHAAFLIGRLLGPQHKEIGLKQSGTLGWEDLWNSNVIFVGKPALNPAIKASLPGADFAEDAFGVIRNLRPKPGESPEYRSATTHGSGVKYAVITVGSGPQSGRHLMILSGAGSEFLWALAEYVTNPEHVAELVSHLRTASGELPPAFQVLIEASFESNVPIRIRYVTHRVSTSS